jgi:hypothetical protein
VLVQDARRVVLESNHEVTLRQGRLRMDRFAYFAAGEPFFRLGIRVTALGPGPITYAYLYGDEPWVGTFGTASGNLGWTEGALVPVEAALDPRTTRWAGIVDLKSGYANYLEWLGDDLPDDLYFANHPGKPAPGAARVALSSNEVFIGLQWVGRRLAPGEGRSMQLVVGLAAQVPGTGEPTRPAGAAGP